MISDEHSGAVLVRKMKTVEAFLCGTDF